MAQEERDRVKNDLEAKEKELKKAQDEQAQLSTKLQVCVVYHHSVSYDICLCNAQAALPTGLKQPLIIEGKDTNGQRQLSPTPGAIYIEIQGGGGAQSAQHPQQG